MFPRRNYRVLIKGFSTKGAHLTLKNFVQKRQRYLKKVEKLKLFHYILTKHPKVK